MNNPKQVVFKLVERIAPSNSHLRASVSRFPVPQEWLDEEEEEQIFVGKPDFQPDDTLEN